MAYFHSGAQVRLETSFTWCQNGHYWMLHTAFESNVENKVFHHHSRKLSRRNSSTINHLVTTTKGSPQSINQQTEAVRFTETSTRPGNLQLRIPTDKARLRTVVLRTVASVTRVHVNVSPAQTPLVNIGDFPRVGTPPGKFAEWHFKPEPNVNETVDWNYSFEIL